MLDNNLDPDCRLQFLHHMEAAASEALATPMKLWTPFLYSSKTEIVRLGLSLNVPYEKTWTCYAGGETPCHECDACVRRERAFNDNGLTDPLCQGEAE